MNTINFKEHWRLFVLLDLIIIGIVAFVFWDTIFPPECETISNQSRCEQQEYCEWEEGFEHDGIGPTGEFFCDDKPQLRDEFGA